MSKLFFVFLFFLFSFNLPLAQDSFNIIKLTDFTKTEFTLDNEFLIFEYHNDVNNTFKYDIDFILDEGYKSSTKVLFYDSYEKIERGDEGFINYVGSTTLKETKEFKISYSDSFYKNKITYYIVLYDISNTYSDSIYTLNSIDYLPFKDSFYYHNTLEHELHFNFLIQETNSKYFYYQAKAIDGYGFVADPTAHFRLSNEKGEIFFNDNTKGLSQYVKIEPYIKYYFEVTLYKRDIFGKKIFMMNFTNYSRNILLEEGKEVERNILCAQDTKYFKDISNLTQNETMNFKFKILESSYHCDNFYIKYYDSNNFTKLEKSFPGGSGEYDNNIGYLREGGTFNYELKKKYNSQKGVLFGVFVDRCDSLWSIQPTSIYVSVNKKSEEDEVTDKAITDNISDNNQKDKTDSSNSSESSGSSVGEILLIILAIIVNISILAACYWVFKNKCSSSSSYSSSSYDNYDVILIKRDD